MTTAQINTLHKLETATVTVITKIIQHPYSGAITLENNNKVTEAIIESDGRLSYVKGE